MGGSSSYRSAQSNSSSKNKVEVNFAVPDTSVVAKIEQEILMIKYFKVQHAHESHIDPSVTERLNLPYRVSCQKSDCLCGEAVSLLLEYQSYPFQLKEQLMIRAQSNNPFTQSELWYLLYWLANIAEFIWLLGKQSYGLCVEDVNLNEQGEISIEVKHSLGLDQLSQQNKRGCCLRDSSQMGQSVGKILTGLILLGQPKDQSELLSVSYYSPPLLMITLGLATRKLALCEINKLLSVFRKEIKQLRKFSLSQRRLKEALKDYGVLKQRMDKQRKAQRRQQHTSFLNRVELPFTLAKIQKESARQSARLFDLSSDGATKKEKPLNQSWFIPQQSQDEAKRTANKPRSDILVKKEGNAGQKSQVENEKSVRYKQFLMEHNLRKIGRFTTSIPSAQ